MVPMFHGTNDEIAKRIAENGFGVVTGTDSGFYGRGFLLHFPSYFPASIRKIANMKPFVFNSGIYFTSDVEYAKFYSKESRMKVVIIALTLPGNVYPITEAPFADSEREVSSGLNGQAFKDGFQSHYILGLSFHFPFSILGQWKRNKKHI